MSEKLTLTLDVELSPNLRNLLTQLAKLDSCGETSNVLPETVGINTHKRIVQEKYDQGVRDGRAEAQQEHAMKPAKYPFDRMVAYERVNVCLRGGMAPFEFEPYFVTTFGRLTPNKREQLGEAMIGTPHMTVGIFGMNKLAKKAMFITAIDHFTLVEPAKEA